MWLAPPPPQTHTQTQTETHKTFMDAINVWITQRSTKNESYFQSLRSF